MLCLFFRSLGGGWVIFSWPKLCTKLWHLSSYVLYLLASRSMSHFHAHLFSLEIVFNLNADFEHIECVCVAVPVYFTLGCKFNVITLDCKCIKGIWTVYLDKASISLCSYSTVCHEEPRIWNSRLHQLTSNYQAKPLFVVFIGTKTMMHLALHGAQMHTSAFAAVYFQQIAAKDWHFSSCLARWQS